MARAASALVRGYLDDATHKLLSIARMIDRSRDMEEQARLLNALIEPRGLFLEAGSWTVGPTVEVQAQVQREEFARSQSVRRPAPAPPNEDNVRDRAFNPRLNQFVQTVASDDPIVTEPARGKLYIADACETAGGFPVAVLSVPVSSRTILTANLDLRPVSQMFESLAGTGPRVLVLLDGDSRAAASSRPGEPAAAPDALSSALPIGRGRWAVVVREPRETALAPLRQARLQALLVFGPAGALAAGLAAVLSVRVLRPVRALAAAADRLGRGDRSARWPASPSRFRARATRSRSVPRGSSRSSSTSWTTPSSTRRAAWT